MASTKRADGEGSIYFDESRNRYVGSFVAGWRFDPVTGKRSPIRRKVSGKSRAAAASKLRDLREKINAGSLPAGRVPTVAEWLHHWLDEIAAAKIRENTMRGYRTYVEQYLVPLLGQHRLDRLTPEHVEAAWKYLQQTGRPGVAKPKPLSSTSALQAHRILARSLRVAQQRGLVQRNVATLIDAPSRRDVEMTPLTVAEARKLLVHVEQDRLAARWSVALALGLRQGEALGLTWENVDLEGGELHVRQALARITGKGLVVGPVKSRASRRTVALDKVLLDQLRAHKIAQNAERLAARNRWDDRGFVFSTIEGKPLDPRADWQAWKSHLAAAGVNSVRLHDARHTAATLLLAQGVQPRVVMEILGHSQISITSRYQHVVDDMQRDAAARVGSALWGSS